MAELPVLPLNVAALMADTAHMTTEEFGAYCRILFTMWLRGGRLPDDNDQLAKIAGMTRTRFKHRAALIREPLTNGGGQLSQKRLTDTFLRVRETRKQRALAAQKRWAGHRTNAHKH